MVLANPAHTGVVSFRSTLAIQISGVVNRDLDQ